MVEVINALRLALLKRVIANPDLDRAKLGAAEADLAYLLQMEMVREDQGRIRATHLGQMVLKRGL
ncbi:MAG TPA: hypothetical protein VJ483_05720 [Holophagaceae bacterium]|nr:hypothetical protein [Holophagaceae bacterium]